MGKIISKNEVEEIKELKKQGKKIVLCHGVFDLVHPGHIIHFQEAKKLGDVLVVSSLPQNMCGKDRADRILTMRCA